MDTQPSRTRRTTPSLAAVVAAAALLVAACGATATVAPVTPGAATASLTPATAAPVATPEAPATPAATARAVATPAPSGEVTVYGAASLKAVLAKAKIAFEAANPAVTLVIATDSSAALEAKIEQGAPADVFLSADTANPAKLVAGGFALGVPVNFAGNSLALIVPADNLARVTSPKDLSNAGVKIIACGDKVPITAYAARLVANLAGVPGYPADFAAKYAANIASREDNVAAIVSKIELGEGDAGIVYVTDAHVSGKVLAVPLPDGTNVAATYAGVVVKAAGNPAAAEAFLAWLAGPDGGAILASFGFLTPT